MWKKVALIAIILAILGGAFFVVWRFLLGHNGRFVTKTNPMKIGAVIEKEGISKLIGTEGGDIELAGDNGTKYAINFPENSVIGNEAVVMRKINSLSGLGEGMRFIGGVELTPDNTSLVELATLSITLPDGVKTENIRGFVFDGDGNNFHFSPVKFVDGKAILPVDGFSGHGIIDLTDPKKYPSEPSAIEKQAKQNLALGMSVSGRQQFWGKEIDSEAQKQTALDIFRDWFNQDLKWKLIAAVKDENKIEDGVGAFYRWLKWVQFYGFTDDLAHEIEIGENFSASAIKNGGEKSSKKCVDEKDAFQVGRMLTLARYTMLLGLNGRSGLNEDELKNKAKKCAKFEIRISSTFEVETSVGGGKDIGKFSGVIPLSTDDGFALLGEGQVKMDSYLEMVGTPSEHGCKYSREMVSPVEIRSTQIKAFGGKPSVSLNLILKDPGELNWDCSWVIPGTDTTFGYTGGQGTTMEWDGDTMLLHEDELVQLSETEALLPILDWEIVNKGGIFARKVFQQSRVFGGFGASSTETENTVFELVHTPER